MRDAMGFDVRVPLGVFFTLVGTILAGYGVFGGAAIYHRALGINLNLIWGIVLGTFGLAMLYASRRRRAA
jgi:hypothetical protein